MKRKEFDYYIFIDYSENLIGYNIIENDKIRDLLPRISKFRHYKGSKGRKIYLKHIKNTIIRERIKSYFEKIKIRNIRDNIELFAEVLKFVRNHEKCIIFISVDDFQFRSFKKLVEVVDENAEVVKESQLKKGSPEYQLSLVIDNLLNIERRRQNE